MQILILIRNLAQFLFHCLTHSEIYILGMDQHLPSGQLGFQSLVSLTSIYFRMKEWIWLLSEHETSNSVKHWQFFSESGER